MRQIFDCWVNAISSDFQPPWNPKVGEALAKRFPNLEAASAAYTDIEALIGLMDEAGVTKAILSDPYGSEALRKVILSAIDRYPDRFLGAAAVHPTIASEDKMLVRNLKSQGFVAIKLLGVFSGLPYDHPKYFPIFSICEEEHLVVTCNVGMALVPISAQHQDPLTLDIALAHFPDLKIVMCHGGLPWADTCVALMRKWPNLYWIPSDIATDVMPSSIVDYGRTDGKDRLMMATGFPALSFEEKVSEVGSGGLFEGEAAENYAWKNANRVFLNSSL